MVQINLTELRSLPVLKWSPFLNLSSSFNSYSKRKRDAFLTHFLSKV